ncbi:ABC transporter permease [Microbispora sp. H10949]|uniref:ABC transporter permease n=1 Tax=Microbispora sp. H10949 TaxID=2729111 RepID=UPI002873679B|nr:ABC transporter permease [Microbispora sp. H10949]
MTAPEREATTTRQDVTTQDAGGPVRDVPPYDGGAATTGQNTASRTGRDVGQNSDRDTGRSAGQNLGPGPGIGHTTGRSAGGDLGAAFSVSTGASAGASIGADSEAGADVEGGADARTGAAAGYRPRGTLRVLVELRRQWRRRRTQLVFALIALLPLVLVAAFEIGGQDPARSAVTYADLAVTSGPNFVVFTLYLAGSLLLPVVVALFFGDAVASEASWSSLKYLLAIPVPRLRLLRQKAVTAALLSLLALGLLPVVALIAGVIWYGPGDATSPAGDAVPFGRSVVMLAVAVGYTVVQLAWVGALALWLSVTVDAPLGAVGGAALASVLSQILDQITALGSFRDLLPTHHAWAWIGLFATDADVTGMADGLLVSLVYALVFGVLAAYRFSRKDITT